jgi:hypothetical protein
MSNKYTARRILKDRESEKKTEMKTNNKEKGE